MDCTLRQELLKHLGLMRERSKIDLRADDNRISWGRPTASPQRFVEAIGVVSGL